MFQPSTVVFNSKHLYIERHERTDYMRGAPLREKINLLRYEFIIKWHGPQWRNKTRIVINKGGKAAIKFSNFIYRMRNR